MAAENVELVRRGMAAFIDSDFEGWFAVASPEVKLYPRPEEPGVRDCYVGWDELLEYMINWYSGWEDYTVEPVELIDHGDWVIVDIHEVGIAEQTGLRVEDNFAHAFLVRDGKIVEWRMFGPVDEALQALGGDG